MKGKPRIGLDLTGVDGFHMGNGQYRYAVDLIRGLGTLAASRADFVVFGTQGEPIPEIGGVIAACGWAYRSMKPRSFPGAFYWGQIEYSRAIARQRLNLMHSMGGMPPLFATCPTVLTIHDLMYELFPEYKLATQNRLYRLWRWGVRRRVARAICISKTTAQDVARLWTVPDQYLDVIYHGTEFSAIDEQHAASPHATADTLLSLYNLEPRKNLMALLDALAILRRSRPNVRLLLFGRTAVTNERESEFYDRLRSLGLEECVELVGHVSDEQLRCLYSSSTLFVFPSLYEGFGLPLLEAMRCGCCVVARDASAMAEVVGSAGALVETQRPESLAAAIEGLLANPAERERLKETAKVRASGFSIERMATETWNTYMRAMGGSVALSE